MSMIIFFSKTNTIMSKFEYTRFYTNIIVFGSNNRIRSNIHGYIIVNNRMK